MTVEFNAKKIMGFPLVPACSGINWRYRRNSWVIPVNPGTDDDSAEIEIVAAEIVYDLHLIFLDPVDSGNAFYEKIEFVYYLYSDKELFRVDLGVDMITMNCVISCENTILAWCIIFFFGFFLRRLGAFLLPRATLPSAFSRFLLGMARCSMRRDFGNNGKGRRFFVG